MACPRVRKRAVWQKTPACGAFGSALPQKIPSRVSRTLECPGAPSHAIIRAMEEGGGLPAPPTLGPSGGLCDLPCPARPSLLPRVVSPSNFLAGGKQGKAHCDEPDVSARTNLTKGACIIHPGGSGGWGAPASRLLWMATSCLCTSKSSG